jgi:hypothetical protein
VLALLWIVLMVAFALRLRGLNAWLPAATEPDCKIPLQVELTEYGVEHPARHPEYQWYPALIARAALLLPRAERPSAQAGLAPHLSAASQSVGKVRLVAATVSVLAVAATFLWTRLFASSPVALLSAALCATSLLHLSFSQQARPHGPSSATYSMAVLGAVALLRRGGPVGHGLAGAGLGLALGTLQSGVACVGSSLVAHGLRARARGNRLRDWCDPWLLLFAGLTLGLVRLAYPFWFDRELSAGELEQDGPTLSLGGHLIFANQLNGKGALVCLRTLWSFDPVLLLGLTLGLLLGLAGVVGRARASRERGRTWPAFTPEGWIGLAFAGPYALMLLLYERTYERFLLPLVPFLCCASALAFAQLARQLRLGRRSAALGAALLLALPSAAAWKLSSIRAAPSTHFEAARWIAAHVQPSTDVSDPAPAGPTAAERLAVAPIAVWPNLELPLWWEPQGLHFWGRSTVGILHLWWGRYQARLPGGCGAPPRYPLFWMKPDLARMREDPLGYLTEQGGNLAVVEVFAGDRVDPAPTRLRAVLKERARLLARFSPDRHDGWGEHPLGYQDETSVAPPHFLRRVLSARTTGPVIEIYDLRGLIGPDAPAGQGAGDTDQERR